MDDNMTLSPNGVKFIHQFEGVSLKAYKDYVDDKGNVRYSIGYGHNGKVDGKTITPDLVITKEKAEELFLEDVDVFVKKVKQYIKVPLNQNQFDAMVSLAYNVRTSNWVDFIERSQINSGVYDKVPEALMKYVVSDGKTLRGLVRRRTEEGKLFTTPVHQPAPPVVEKLPDITIPHPGPMPQVQPPALPPVQKPVIAEVPTAKPQPKASGKDIKEKASVTNKKPKNDKSKTISKKKPTSDQVDTGASNEITSKAKK